MRTYKFEAIGKEANSRARHTLNIKAESVASAIEKFVDKNDDKLILKLTLGDPQYGMIRYWIPPKLRAPNAESAEA